jgi:hypothetical protein
VQEYCVDSCISISTTPKYLILDINIDDNDYRDWIEGDGWLSNLAGLRDELLQGDFRVLYLAWLKAKTRVSDEHYPFMDESDILEPSLPNNLQELSDAQASFVEFFKVNQDLIAAAAKNSHSTEEEVASWEELIPILSEAERNEFLVKVLKNEPLVGAQLAKRLRELSQSEVALAQGNRERRSLSQLIASAEEHSKLRKKQGRKTFKRARIAELEALVPKQAKIWQEISRLIGSKQSKLYDEVVAHLINLRDLAEYQGKMAEFELQVQQIQTDYGNRHGLISRMQKAGLLSL